MIENQAQVWSIGLAVSLLLGGIVTYFVVRYLRKQINRWENEEGKRFTRFTIFLGTLERLLYTICIAFDVNFLIGVWIALKLAHRWAPQDSMWYEYLKREGVEPLEKNGIDKKPEIAVGAITILLIGNLLSLLFGIIGGVLIKKLTI